MVVEDTNDPLGLAQLLPRLIGLVAAYYVLRVAAAAFLLLLSRQRPGLRGAAMACAPAMLRPWLRRAVAGGLLGLALTGAPALASASGCPQPGGTPVLDRAASCGEAAQPASPAGSGSAAGAADTAVSDPAPASVNVRPGDSLWNIAAGLLGADAPDSAVAAAWPKIWTANEGTIGADPDLIRPGTALIIPADLIAEGSR